MFDQITPVILTFNEASNIARTLAKLSWAKDIVIVDSLSTDDTLAIVAGFPNVRVFSHPITSLADQWNFAVHETGITTDWVLRLDADYVLTDPLIAEIAALKPGDVAGYRVNFIYCIHGRPLRASIYPAAYKLFRREGLSFFQDGHTERPRFEGRGENLKGSILHDDRKPLSRWLWSQDRYMTAEARKLAEKSPAELSLIDRIRRSKAFAPIFVLVHCLFVKRLILDGWAGIYYAFQRTAAEMILSLNLLDLELRATDDQATSRPGVAPDHTSRICL